jgi:voltage-gated sodium channel
MNIGTSPATWRLRLAEVFENYWTHKVITWLILISIITLGLETSETAMSYAGKLIYFFNRFVICLFVVEIVARIIAHGLDFFKDPWHIFDFIVVLIAVITFGGYFQIFRVLRVIWFIRTTTMFEETAHLINSLIRAIPHMLSAAMLLVGAIYVFAVIGTAEYGTDHPHLFGSVYTSMATIIQSALMEHTWSERLDELYKNSPYAWAYIIPMIIILNFLLLQLVFGIIINALRHQYDAEQEQEKHSFLDRFIAGEKPKTTEPHPMSAETQLILAQLNDIKEQLKSSKK